MDSHIVLKSLYYLLFISFLSSMSSCCAIKYTDQCLYDDVFGENGKYQFIDPEGDRRRYYTISDILLKNMKENFGAFPADIQAELIADLDVDKTDPDVKELISKLTIDEYVQGIMNNLGIKRPPSPWPPPCFIVEIWELAAAKKLINDRLRSYEVVDAKLSGQNGVGIPGIMNNSHEIDFLIPEDINSGEYSYKILLRSIRTKTEFPVELVFNSAR